MDLQLKDKVAFISGASQGLGFATALKLSEEGARVAINSRSRDRINKARKIIEEKTGNPVLALDGDITKPGKPKRFIDKINRQWGQLDILVTNAGGPPSGKFEDFGSQAWQHAIELSFLSHVRQIRAALPYLRKSNAASVLSITSISVKQPIENLILSNSIRLATIGLIKSLALELGGENIRFNSILPGSTYTKRIEELTSKRAKENNTTVEEEMENNARSSALGRIATPEEFANVATFLVSPAASYLTGVMLPVDGGSYKGTF